MNYEIRDMIDILMEKVEDKMNKYDISTKEETQDNEW